MQKSDRRHGVYCAESRRLQWAGGNPVALSFRYCTILHAPALVFPPHAPPQLACIGIRAASESGEAQACMPAQTVAHRSGDVRGSTPPGLQEACRTAIASRQMILRLMSPFCERACILNRAATDARSERYRVFAFGSWRNSRRPLIAGHCCVAMYSVRASEAFILSAKILELWRRVQNGSFKKRWPPIKLVRCLSPRRRRRYSRLIPLCKI